MPAFTCSPALGIGTVSRHRGGKGQWKAVRADLVVRGRVAIGSRPSRNTRDAERHRFAGRARPRRAIRSDADEDGPGAVLARAAPGSGAQDDANNRGDGTAHVVRCR